MFKGYLLLVLVCTNLILSAQKSIDLSGKVSSGSGPVEAASVQVLNTNKGAITDQQGKFNIQGLPAGRYSIQVSAIGFASMEKQVDLQTGNGVTIAITLEDASRSLDAVVVTAQKREELLRTVPLSVTALSARDVEQYRLWNTKDLTSIVPNLYSANSGDDRNVTSIRGIATTSYDPAVATYVDGVNQFSLDTYIPQLMDIARIEVLRGPQGTLYGRNAMGGVINIITKQPNNASTVFAEASIGNFSQQRYMAGARAPLIKDKFFFGAAALYDKRDGFYHNDFYNNSFDKQEKVSGNFYLKFLQGKWSFVLNAKNQDAKNDGAFPLVNGKEDALANPYVLSQDAIARMIDKTFNSSLVINYAGAGFNFSSQTAYQINHRYYDKPLDGDFSPIDGVSVINNYGDGWNKVKAWTQEFKFSSPAATTSKLKWTAGTYFFDQKNPNKQAIYFGDDAALVGAPDVNFSLISSTKGKSYGAAIFGQLNYAINPRLSVIAGLRFDTEKKSYNILGEYQKDPDPNPQFETRPDTSASANFHAFSPKLGIAYEASAFSNLFVNYSRGYRTGGLTQLSSDPSQPPLYPYKPEYSNNIEAGIKNSLLDNRLHLNLTFFFTTVTDAQVPTLVLPDAITITRNAGKLTSKGAELELSAVPANGLQFDYSFGYTDASYKSLKLSQNGSTADLDGKKQIFTPAYTSMLAAQYSISLSSRPSIRLVARGEWSALGKQYFDLANTITQSGYSLFNARLGVALKNVELMFWGRNLGEEKYIAYAYDFGAIHLGDPRTYGATLKLQLNHN